ncbi:MAG: hypothetical protein RBG13Loki_2069 [Promethearchaeota archaeon CR_4]|nr:MAG: hypothetical protein RBG13Loki_2069 [Candidatus Lokiarchaeota archaeon CR_4]
MDAEKINAVGQTLDVEISEIKQDMRQRIGKILCTIVQGAITLGSILLGCSYGMVSGYPFSLSPWTNFGSGMLIQTLIHTGNGIFLIPRKMRFDLSGSQRIKIFLGNLLLSVALFVISFGTFTNWRVYPANTLYSTYDNQQDYRLNFTE